MQTDAHSRQESRMLDSVTGDGTPSTGKSATCVVGEEMVSFSAASEDAVDNFLAGVLDCNPDLSASPVPAAPPPERPSIITVQPPGSAFIEEHRRMLLPLVLENARRREPDADEDTLAARVRPLLTDDWVEEMVNYRQRVLTEMHERELHATDDEESGVVGMKRPRVADEKDDVARQNKSRRMDESLDAVTPRANQDGPHLASETAQESIRSTLDSAMLIMEEHLASRTTKENGSHHLAARMDQNHELDATPDAHMSSVDDPPTAPLAGYTSRGDSQKPPDGYAIPEESMAVVEPPQSHIIPVPVHDPAPLGGSTSINHAVNGSLPPREDPSTASVPLNRVPGLWTVTVGSKIPQITDIPFEVEEEVVAAAHRWARRRVELDVKQAHVSVHLLCLPTALVADVNRNLNPAATPADVAAALWNIPTRWPTKGTLVIEMNPGQSSGSHAFLPKDLGPSNGPLELTAHVLAGLNSVRLVQLRDMSDFVFVVHAAIPNAEECNRFAALSADARDWTAFLRRASSRIPGVLPGQFPLKSTRTTIA